MTDRDLMKQALDALRQCEFTTPPAQRQIVKNAITALTERPAQPEQEQWDAIPDAFNDWWNADYDDTGNPYRKDSPAYWAWSGWKAASKQPEQEPVAEVKPKITGGNVGIATVIHEIYSPYREPLQPGDKLYTAPPQHKPLTDDLYNELLFAVARFHPNETRHQTALRYIQQAESGGVDQCTAAHGIKEKNA